MRFGLALRVAARSARRRGELTDEQFNTVIDTCNQFGSPTCMCSDMEDIVRRKAVEDGALSGTEEHGSINWAGLLSFFQGIWPLILAMITAFSPKPTPAP